MLCMAVSSFLPVPRLGLVNPEGYIAFSLFPHLSAIPRCELRVAQNFAHQRDPQVRRAPPVDARLGERSRKAESRERGHDYVECVGRVAAKGGWVGQRTNHLV